MITTELPARANIVIVGGGVWGTSIAAHLAEQGERDVLLLERFDLADGSSWAAAGFVGQLRHSPALVRIVAHSARQFAEAERQLPGVIGWRGVGSLRVARTPARVAEIEELTAMARSVGVETEVLTPAQVTAKFPMVSADEMLCAAWTPSDGWVVPERLARYFGDRATDNGARVVTGVAVASLIAEGDSVVGVRTDQGDVYADTVIVAAGAFSGVLTATVGISTPVVATRINYFVTKPVPGGALDDLPTIREPDSAMYLRSGFGRVVIGGGSHFPHNRFPAELVPARREHSAHAPVGLDKDYTDAARRIPMLKGVGISHPFNAWESIVPDDTWIIGPSHVSGLWVCAGGGGFGIAASGGVGDAVARSILDGETDTLLEDFTPTRFPRDFVIGQAKLEEMEQVMRSHYDLSPVRSH